MRLLQKHYKKNLIHALFFYFFYFNLYYFFYLLFIYYLEEEKNTPKNICPQFLFLFF